MAQATVKRLIAVTRPVALTLALACAAGTLLASSKVYTLDADFDLGVLSGVNHTAPNNHQLQLNKVGTTFPIMWIANGGEDTVSKIDTVNNKEIARYRTWFGPAGQAGHVSHLGDPFSGPAPSRTAVDLDGNAYVANRWFSGSRQAWVLKILAEGGIDRNGNGVIDTSSDLNNDGVVTGAEIKPMADANGDNRVDVAEIQDERIAWAVSVGPNNGLGRALCIGTDGHLWVGLYNDRSFYKISSVDGSVLAGPISTTPTAGQPNSGAWTPYGCLVDASGTLWSASLSTVMGKIQNTHLNPTVAVPNPYVVASFGHGVSGNYGIALGHDRVFLGLFGGGSYAEFNPATNTFIFPAAMSFAATGISVDATGEIVTGPFSGGGVTKFKWATDATNGSVIWTRGTQLSSETRGVIVDSDNNVWQVSRTGNVVMKHRGTDGTPLGVFPVGNHPYTYSDATGLSQRTQTTPSGTWTVVQDGGAAATQWGTINWTDFVPTGGNVQVRSRSADTIAGLSLETYQAAVKGMQFTATGRFIQVEARLTANTNNDSPILFDLSITSRQNTCDVNLDGRIDQRDLALISRARGQRASGPNDPRDSDGDGLITPNDVKVCLQRCTLPGCAIQ